MNQNVHIITHHPLDKSSRLPPNGVFGGTLSGPGEVVDPLAFSTPNYFIKKIGRFHDRIPKISTFMLLRTLYTALLISSVCARPAPGQLTKRAYQNYGSNKVRGGSATPPPPQSFGPRLISVLCSQSWWVGDIGTVDYSFHF
jgi:hypothetical protein